LLLQVVRVNDCEPQETTMQPNTSHATQVLTCTAIVGSPVRNRRGEDLARVHELMIDVDAGQAVYAVLTFDDFWEEEDKLIAVPWTALTWNAEDRSMILDVSRERLANAPGFDRDHWPDMGDTSWGNTIHRYHGRRAYPE
jgi:sporulation protein YlmC with PRC-barrel domain